jgi:hypothetical protein
MSYYLSVRFQGTILFEIFNREGGVSLTQAWAAALPAVLATAKQNAYGSTELVLRIDDQPVIQR